MHAFGGTFYPNYPPPSLPQKAATTTLFTPFTREMHLLDGIKLETQFTAGGGGHPRVLVGNKNENHTYTTPAIQRAEREWLAPAWNWPLSVQRVAAVNCTLVLWAGLSDIEAKPFIHLKYIYHFIMRRSFTRDNIQRQRVFSENWWLGGEFSGGYARWIKMGWMEREDSCDSWKE